jgi:hypothetical protein
MREALSTANSDMIQPGLLIIGNDYNVKIDQLFMKIENASLELGLAYVVGYYHVLNLRYPLPLKFVFVFFETLFGMPPLIKSTCVENLQSHLAALTSLNTTPFNNKICWIKVIFFFHLK